MRITDEAVEAFTQYRRSQVAELRPWQSGDDMSGVSISAEDAKAGSPKSGDMIARNPKNRADQWLVAAAYFADNFEPISALPHLSQGGEGENVISLSDGDRQLLRMVAPFVIERSREPADAWNEASALLWLLVDTNDPVVALSPDPVGVTDEGQLPTRAEAAAAAKLLLRCNGFDLDQWGGGDLMDDFPMDALKTLASHEPAPTDTQEGLSEAGEVVAYGEVLSGKVATVRIDKSRHCIEPLVRQSALTACQQEVERLRVKLSFAEQGQRIDNINSNGFYRKWKEAEARNAELQQEVETLREGIKEIAEREQSIRDNWVRFEAETGARILELEADLEIANDKLRRFTDALTPSVDTKAAYMGEFHMGVTLMHNGDEDHRRVMIPWTTIKEIMAAIRARAVLGGQSNE